MKKEIELKFFVADLSAVRKKLKRLGAKLDWAGRERDAFLDTPNGLLKRTRRTLRIRTNGISFLTYKESMRRDGYKANLEYQLEVSNAKELQKIFERLGFKVVFQYRKSRREYWKIKNALITLDSYPFGKFVEIEAPTSVIKYLARKLNLDFAKSSIKSYRTLLEEHFKKPR